MKMQLTKAEAKVLDYPQMLDSVVVLQSYEEGISSSNLGDDENYRESIDEEAEYDNHVQGRASEERMNETASSMQTSGVNQSVDQSHQ